MLKKLKEKNKIDNFEELKKMGVDIYALPYCRVSSDKQAKEGNGLDAQKHRCIEFAKSRGYIIDEKNVFQDTASGGGEYTSRQGQVDLLKRIDQFPHRNFVVIVDETSRLARDVQAHFALRDALRMRGVPIESPNFNFDDSPEGEMSEGIAALSNQYFRKVNKRKVIQNQKARLELGYWPFVAIRGYRMIKDPTAHGKIAILDDIKAQPVKYALEGFSKGTFMRKVDACKYLIESGVWKGKYPEKYIDEFDEMLRDPFYPGLIEYLPWEVKRHPGKHDALISIETFEQNQRRLKNEFSGKKIRVDLREDFLLRGLIVCGECGKHLTAGCTTKKKGKKRKFPYYLCQNRECSLYRKSVDRDKTHERFSTILKEQKLKPEIGKLVEAVFDRVWKEEVQFIKTKEITIRRERELSDDKITEITEMIVKARRTGNTDLEQIYEKQIQKITKNVEDLSSGSMENIDLAVPYRTALEKVTGMLKKPYAVWNKMNLIEKHKLFFFIFEGKLWYHRENGYRTDKVLSYTRLFESFVTSKSDNVDLWGIEPQPRPCHGRVLPLNYRPYAFKYNKKTTPMSIGAVFCFLPFNYQLHLWSFYWRSRLAAENIQIQDV